MIDLRAEWALLLHQMRTGVRVALRSVAPLAAAAAAAAVIYGSPMVVLAPLVTVLYPPAPSAGAAVLAGLLGVGLSAGLAPRLMTGLDGWIRHLPASGQAHRRAVTAGLVVAQTPFLALVLMAGLTVLGQVPTVIRLLGLPLLAWGSALAVVPTAGRARVLACLAAGVCFSGTTWALVLAVVLVVAAEATAGGLTAGRRRRAVHRPWVVRSPNTASAGRLWLVISGRALGWRMAGNLALAVLALAPVLLFLRNNQLSSAQQLLAVRCAGLLAGALVIGAAADGLARRRPPWPWVRSLPWSATHRVALDASLLAMVAAPAVVAAGLLRTPALWSLLAPLPFMAVRGASAIRRAPERASAAAGQVMAEGFLCAALVALVPMTAVVLVALMPVALHLAAAQEREQDVSRWHELHHLAAGDSLSWGDR